MFDFNHESRIVSITMPKNATKIQYKTVQTLHNSELFKINESSRLSKEDQKVFHRTVMMILYNDARVRPDILCHVNLLIRRTRLGTASEKDNSKLLRLLNYIRKGGETLNL